MKMYDKSLFANSVLDECDSTNTVAKHLAEEGCPHGTWISARHQSAGRGRHGRGWVSQEGNLFLSVIARIEDKDLWSWIPLATAAAAVKTIRQQAPHLKIKIKWPNDLWLEGSKLGGILCEGVLGRNPYVIIGIGMNCVQAPDLSGFSTTSLKNFEGISESIDADVIRPILLTKLKAELDSLIQFGKSPLKEFYECVALFQQGSVIEWGAPRKLGRVIGLGEASELVVSLSDGSRSRLYAEDVQLRCREVYSDKMR